MDSYEDWNRPHVNVDRGVLDDVIEEHCLSSSEWPVLLYLALLAEWKSHTWTGSLGEWAGRMRMGRNTVEECLAKFEREGLVEVLRPFRQGGKGTLKVSVYGRLVVPNKSTRGRQMSSGYDRDLTGISPGNDRERNRWRDPPAQTRETTRDRLESREDEVSSRKSREGVTDGRAHIELSERKFQEAKERQHEFPGAEEVS